MNPGKPSAASADDPPSLESIDRQAVDRLGEAYRKIADELRSPLFPASAALRDKLRTSLKGAGLL